MNKGDNSIFFLTISLICVWLVVDYVIGKKYIGKFLSMLPFLGGDDSETEKTVHSGTVTQPQGTVQENGINIGNTIVDAYKKASGIDKTAPSSTKLPKDKLEPVKTTFENAPNFSKYQF